jgi:hypothetical protein
MKYGFQKVLNYKHIIIYMIADFDIIQLQFFPITIQFYNSNIADLRNHPKPAMLLSWEIKASKIVDFRGHQQTIN